MRRVVRVWVIAASLGGCTAPVAAGLEEIDANRVLVALGRAGFEGTKEVDPNAEGRFRVTVPREDSAPALSAMAEEHVPRAKPRGLLDATERGQLVPSPATEHAQLVAGLSGELERTLEGVDGVIEARVHMFVPVRDGLRENGSAKATASVLLEHRGAVSPLPLEAVQKLVAGGAPGLAPADVGVVFVAHAASSPFRGSSAATSMVRVGPVMVARGSSLALKVTFALLVLAVLGVTAAALALYARLVAARALTQASTTEPRLTRAGGSGSPL